MAVEKIKIIIDKNGDITVDLDGFKGKGCEAIMDILEKHIGPAKRKNKPDYYQGVILSSKEEEKVNA